VTKHLAGLAGAQRKSVLALSRRQTWRHVETAAILLAVIVGIAVIAVITRNQRRGRDNFDATAVATTSGSETQPAAGRDADSTSPSPSAATNSSTKPITKPKPDIESEPDTGPTELDTPGGSADTAIPRKELRRALFDAAAQKRWAAAADAGLQMRGSYEVDWEAALVLADALVRARRYEDAIAVYREFLERFPTNHYADKALFRLAECLQAAKRHGEARTAYERLAQKPGKYRKRAKKSLAGLRGR
jgi:pentatricopeptide repeat protein